MTDSIQQFLSDSGFSESWAPALANITTALLIVLACAVSWILVKLILTKVISVYIRRSKSKWDDILLERHLFSRTANLAPAVILYLSAPAFSTMQIWVQRAASSYITLITLLIVFSLMDGFEGLYRTFEVSREKPIKGILQVLKIIFSLIAVIIIVSILLDRSPWVLLSGIGVFSAVLMLVFQNSILGFAAGIQLSGNDMVRVGDWIEMPKYNADGDVIDITLHTVKVQNWDRTITMIPSHAMISDSFKNWRGMTESGGRRIKRAVYIDMNSIQFCTEEMLQRYEQYHYLTDYIKSRRREIEEYNRELGVDPGQLVNGRRMTNIGTFRAYVQAYLENLPTLNKDMAMMVRQLAPTEYGLPIEIYCFTASTRWSEYEAVQADIFDHILAVIPQFDLRIFQSPSGKDVESRYNVLA
ncbi:MAG: mechanosensitive ion channel family protein [Caldicoprobacterales bacterium]|jgi:miniconductance mechanosensitive channel|nr:mechanosensitive ion channel [Clostridiales bacterium]